jgi:serine O-acetyltransferase
MTQPIQPLTQAIVESYQESASTRHIDAGHLPNRDAIIELIKLIRELLFPGYFGKQNLSAATLNAHVAELLATIQEKLFEQVRNAIRHQATRRGAECPTCDATAEAIVQEFLGTIPQLRATLATDVQAAFDGDPAAADTDEIIFSYPGLFAITINRIAHELHKQQVPLIPRIMTEYAHNLTGIDIHPGATLGDYFFIDHGTGVVIGETTRIGDNVKLYQGVTLGALAPGYGQMIRDQKRHPTIEDNVTIYSNSTILGGETVIGRNTTIGGNVFLTSSVPEYNVVSAEPPQLKYRQRGKKAPRNDALDFQI